jgi:hypothetical protein
VKESGVGGHASAHSLSQRPNLNKYSKYSNITTKRASSFYESRVHAPLCCVCVYKLHEIFGHMKRGNKLCAQIFPLAASLRLFIVSLGDARINYQQRKSIVVEQEHVKFKTD